MGSYITCVKFSKFNVDEQNLNFIVSVPNYYTPYTFKVEGKKKWYLDFNPNFKSHKLRIFTNETQTQEEGNELLIHVFRMLARRLIRSLEKTRNIHIILLRKKSLLPLLEISPLPRVSLLISAFNIIFFFFAFLKILFLSNLYAQCRGLNSQP